MRIDDSTSPHGIIFDVTLFYEALDLVVTLEELIHPKGICTTSDGSILTAVKLCRQCHQRRRDTGEIRVYPKPQENMVTLACYCPCEEKLCEKALFVNPHCEKPDRFDLAATTVIDITIPS